MRKLLLLTLTMLVALCTQAKITLPSLITDYMVLQQQTSARLWGEATPDVKISIHTSWGSTAETKADKYGKWQISISTPKASQEEQSIEIKEEKKSGDIVSIKGILIGEVWLASGQSNMEMPLKGFGGSCIKNGALDAMNANRESPYVRMFNVERKQTFTPQSSCNGAWHKPTFENALEYSATAYYFASTLSNALGVPVGIVNASYGGTRVESWTPAEICRQYPDIPQDSIGVWNFTKWSFERPMVTYNAMFHPISQYTYKGIIWYQGCGNVSTYQTYAIRLANMVQHWRKELNLGDIPFYQVQIAPYIYGENENGIGGAMLREKQYEACELIPNCDIVCTNDLVLPIERHNIHPQEKRSVGLRLCLLALNKTYGMKDIACSGPRFDKNKFRIDGDTAIVGFTTNQYGICRNYGIEGFEIAGEDKIFHCAKADFRWQTNEIYLTTPEVPHPVAVRYCFKDFQIGNLIGGNDLPLFPFRTDNW